MADLLQNLVNLLSPNKGFWILIVDSDEILDGFNWLRHTLEYPAPDPFAGDFTKPGSTKFNQEELVGVKCRWNRGCFFNHW